MRFVISNQVVLSRVPEGPIAPYLGRFADSLIATGYTAWWIHRQVLLGAGFSQWLGRKAVALQDMTSDHATNGTHYQDRVVDYEASNAPRWIKMLRKHGHIATPAAA